MFEASMEARVMDREPHNKVSLNDERCVSCSTGWLVTIPPLEGKQGSIIVSTVVGNTAGCVSCLLVIVFTFPRWMWKLLLLDGLGWICCEEPVSPKSLSSRLTLIMFWYLDVSMVGLS